MTETLSHLDPKTETLSHLDPKDVALIAPVALDIWLDGNHDSALNLMNHVGYNRSRALAFFASYRGNENLYRQIWEYQNNYPNNAYKPETWQEQQARKVLATHAPILPEIPNFISASTSGKGEIIIEVTQKTFEFSSEVDGVPILVREIPPEPEDVTDELPRPQITPEELPATADLANYLVTQVFADKLAELGYVHHRVVEDRQDGPTILINFSKTVELEWLGPFRVQVMAADPNYERLPSLSQQLADTVAIGKGLYRYFLDHDPKLLQININPTLSPLSFSGPLVNTLGEALHHNQVAPNLILAAMQQILSKSLPTEIVTMIEKHLDTPLPPHRLATLYKGTVQAWEIGSQRKADNHFYARFIGYMPHWSPRIPIEDRKKAQPAV